MKPTDLAANRLLLMGEDTEVARKVRVIRHSPANDELWLFDCEQPKAFPIRYFASDIQNMPLSVAMKDTFIARSQPDADIDAEHRKKRDQAWSLLQRLLDEGDHLPTRMLPLLNEGERGRRVGLLISQQVSTKPTLYALMRRFWRGGQILNALLPPLRKGEPIKYVPPRDGSRPGRPRKVGADEPSELLPALDSVKLQKAVKLFREKLDEGLTPSTAYIRATDETYGLTVDVDGTDHQIARRGNHDVPSIELLRYHVFGRDPIARNKVHAAILRRIQPADEYDRSSRPRTGTTVRGIRGPGQVYEIDATGWPVQLRSRRSSSEWIGKATLYFVVDQYSQAIVGFHVTLDAEDARGAKMALANACSNKVEFMRSIGIEIEDQDWPMQHVPSELVTDKGPAFTSRLLEEGVRALGVTDTKTPTRRPYYKPFVENSFWKAKSSLLQTKRVMSGGQGLQTASHNLDGKLTLPELRRIIALEVLRLNKTVRVRTVPPQFSNGRATRPTPLELWNFGVALHGAPAMQDSFAIQNALYPRVKFNWTQNGLHLTGTKLYFVPRDRKGGIDLTRLKDREVAGWKGLVEPELLSYAAILLEGGKHIPLELAANCREHFPNWTYGEILEERGRGSVNEAAENVEKNWQSAVFRARQENIVQQATEGKKTAIGTTDQKELRDMEQPLTSALRVGKPLKISPPEENLPPDEADSDARAGLTGQMIPQTEQDAHAASMARLLGRRK